MNPENVSAPKILVFVPTYNESGNILSLFERIQGLGMNYDILFLDDNSPDGTGRIMDDLAVKHSNLKIIHRTGKLGIGSAHKEGILTAYRQGYSYLLTMDADFTHSPENIPDLIRAAQNSDVVVASRYLQKDSLRGWNLMRKALTNTAHLLTRILLGLTQDSTGAFRVYRLDRVPVEFVSHVKSNGYSFFFESLHVLNRNGFKIVEVPVALPPRTYGSSKMSYFEILKSVKQLFSLFLQGYFQPKMEKAKKVNSLLKSELV